MQSKNHTAREIPYTFKSRVTNVLKHQQLAS